MALIVVATVGASNANSFITVAEAQDYMDARLSVTEWDDAESQDVLVVMATRTLVALFAPLRRLVRDKPPYYITNPTWTGLPATTTQALPWPRSGMYDVNGNAISSSIIPQALKDATAEFAAQLAKTDRTLDSDVAVQGITSVRAGSVAVSFKNNVEPQVIPDAVYNLLVPSWLTDELIEQAWPALFDVVSS